MCHYNEWVQEMFFKVVTYLWEFIVKFVTPGTFLWNMHQWLMEALVSRTYGPYIFIQGMNI